ncbi:MAG TPA: radical SAM protein [Puia sp.]|nr:radical SAM protein [Puia sp.]
MQSLFHTVQRLRTLHTHRITAMPIAILMPHSACNCKCVMCDIWKGNYQLSQLTRADIEQLLLTFRKLETKEVVMSGGEALLNPAFFSFCEILKTEQIKITLLSTGLLIKKKVDDLLRWVDELIISLDGDKATHDRIRNVPGAFNLVRTGVAAIHERRPGFRISARTVIQRLNFRNWLSIVDAAKDMGLHHISFLPADITSQAFNRIQPWETPRQAEIRPAIQELPELQSIINELVLERSSFFENHFISESPGKIQKIYDYYAALYGLNAFPYKKCNAPWVSAVIEPDGMVRPCFFHQPIGNIHEESLEAILNSRRALAFRRELDMQTDEICTRCVCYLNLPPGKNPAN